MRRAAAVVYGGVAAAGVAVAAAGALGTRALRASLAESAARRRESAAVAAVRTAVAAVRDAESGRRGYLLTGDPAFLDPEPGHAAVRCTRSLAAARGAGVWPAAAVDALAAAVAARLRELDRSLAAARAGRRDDALAPVRAGEGRRLMAAVLTRAAALCAAADARVADRDRAVEREAAVALAVTPAVAAVAPLAVAVAAGFGLRQFAGRARAEAAAAAAAARERETAALLGALSHDLRTPLNAIAMQVEVAATLVRAGQAEPDRLASALDAVRRSVACQTELLESILALARADAGAGAATPFPVRAVLDDVVHVVAAAAAARGLRLAVVCPPDLEAVTDRTAVRRVVQNLADNAVKFTARGSVTLGARARPGGGLEVAVSDTGPGIAREDVPKLFREFTQVGGHNPHRDPTGGYGLGLATARKLARRLGGDVTVTTAPGVGSTFTLVLPARPTAVTTQDSTQNER